MRDYIAILARTDLPSSTFQLGNPQSAQYKSKAYFKTPLGSFPEPHAWIAVDGVLNGEKFRFIGTHLESSDANVRRSQGSELRAGPANTTLPLVVAMDSNAQAAPPPQDPTYTDFIAAGYSDAWAAIFPQKSGYTCCQAELGKQSRIAALPPHRFDPHFGKSRRGQNRLVWRHGEEQDAGRALAVGSCRCRGPDRHSRALNPANSPGAEADEAAARQSPILGSRAAASGGQFAPRRPRRDGPSVCGGLRHDRDDHCRRRRKGVGTRARWGPRPWRGDFLLRSFCCSRSAAPGPSRRPACSSRI